MDPTASPETPHGAKRKSDEAGQPRAKRNRYISIACNECKRRKIKCNGNQPCQRCGNLVLECVYAPNCCGTNFKDSDEWRQMSAHIASLQEQVDALYANVSSLRSEMSQTAPALDPSLQGSAYMSAPQQPHLSAPDQRTRTPPAPRAPTFRGPTSNAFSFDVAKSSLHTMGIASALNEDDGGTANGSPAGSPRLLQGATMDPKYQKDPIWSVTRGEALRLLDVYEEETHQMYPVSSVDHLRAHTNSLFKFLDAARVSLMRPDAPGKDGIYDDDTNLLKLTLAIALTVEGKGRSEMGQRLFESVQPHVDTLLLRSAGIKDIRLLALTAIYEFHGDNESTAWRVIGLTARLSIELGLHRREIYEKMSPEDRDLSILLFWAIYTLDRRWSFGTGMPFALQDSDIDPQLPRPGDKSLYLTAMIDYCAIGSKVWQAIGADHIGSSTQSSITRENIKYLDYLTRHWYQSLPENLHFDHRILDNPSDRAPSSGSTRLRIVLYLRQNSMLINIYRPVLYSATNIMQNHAQAQEVVSVAKDTIRTLTRINQTSGIYQASQVLFNAFLTSALAVLFLAVSHAPAAFSSQVRDEFYLALDLVRGFSKGSFVSKRLWKTIRVLKEVGPKLGLATDSSGTSSAAEMRPTSAANGNAGQAPVAYGRTTPSASGSADTEDRSRSAALAMAGLAGHNVDGFAYPGGGKHSQPHHAWPTTPSTHTATLASPDNMANDLTRLFEAAGAFDGAGRASSASSGINGGGAYGPPVQQGIVDGGGMEIGFAGEDELSRIMRDLF